MAKPLDITGDRYGRLVAVKNTGRKRSTNFIWAFQCDCGNTKEIPAGEVRRGKTQSCGCLQREVSSEKMDKIRHLGTAKTVTHGKTNTPEYNVWVNMIQRCENPAHKSFKDYGGRGIKVCERWRGSFEAFLSDMGVRPKAGMQIDRKDNDGDYEPDNCHWVTVRKNANNKRSNKTVTHDGKTMTVSEWARQIGMCPKALAYRINSGWPIEEALTMKVNHGNGWERGVRSC